MRLKTFMQLLITKPLSGCTHYTGRCHANYLRNDDQPSQKRGPAKSAGQSPHGHAAFVGAELSACSREWETFGLKEKTR